MVSAPVPELNVMPFTKYPAAKSLVSVTPDVFAKIHESPDVKVALLDQGVVLRRLFDALFVQITVEAAFALADPRNPETRRAIVAFVREFVVLVIWIRSL